MTRSGMCCNDHGGDSGNTHRLRRKYNWTPPISFMAGKQPAGESNKNINLKIWSTS